MSYSANSPSPYAAPNTPIASAKRPRTKKDMHSPVARNAGTSSLGQHPAAELKHKSKGNGKAQSKALFSPSPNGNAIPGDQRSSKSYSAKSTYDDVSSSATNTVYTAAEKVAASSSSSSSSSSISNSSSSSSTDDAIQTPTKVIPTRDSSMQNKHQGLQSPSTTTTEDNTYISSSTCEDDAAGSGSDRGTKEKEAESTEEGEMDENVFNPYQFMAELPSLGSITRNAVSLPPSSSPGKPTLVLDLDETLVHCTVEAIDKPDMTFPVNFNGVLYDVYVRKRPYLDYFLEVVSRSFEVVVFTASQRVYADVLLDLLDPEKKYVSHRLFRESCVLVNGNYLKDLHVCGRDYSQMVLVDNSPHAYGYQIENGIPIESWFDDDNDTELLKLVGFLRRCFTESGSDVRPAVQKHFKTHELIEKAVKGQYIDLSCAPPF